MEVYMIFGEKHLTNNFLIREGEIDCSYVCWTELGFLLVSLFLFFILYSFNSCRISLQKRKLILLSCFWKHFEIGENDGTESQLLKFLQCAGKKAEGEMEDGLCDWDGDMVMKVEG